MPAPQDRWTIRTTGSSCPSSSGEERGDGRVVDREHELAGAGDGEALLDRRRRDDGDRRQRRPVRDVRRPDRRPPPTYTSTTEPASTVRRHPVGLEVERHLDRAGVLRRRRSPRAAAARRCRRPRQHDALGQRVVGEQVAVELRVVREPHPHRDDVVGARPASPTPWSSTTAHTDTVSSAAASSRAPSTTDPATISRPIHNRGSRHPARVTRVATGGADVPVFPRLDTRT